MFGHLTLSLLIPMTSLKKREKDKLHKDRNDTNRTNDATDIKQSISCLVFLFFLNPSTYNAVPSPLA